MKTEQGGVSRTWLAALVRVKSAGVLGLLFPDSVQAEHGHGTFLGPGSLVRAGRGLAAGEQSQQCGVSEPDSQERDPFVHFCGRQEAGCFLLIT